MLRISLSALATFTLFATAIAGMTPVAAQSFVGDPDPTVTLFQEGTPPKAVGRVSTEKWKNLLPVQDVPGSTQFVAIDYAGDAAKSDPPTIAKGRYLVRRSQVMPVASCTLTPVKPGDQDVRHGRNAHGALCQKAP